MDESNMSLEESGSSRILGDLSRSPSPQTEASNRMERMGEAKDVGYQITRPDIPYPSEKHITTLPEGPDAIEEMFRSYLAANVRMFNDSYVYGAVNRNGQGSRSSYDLRYLICPNVFHSWLVHSSGITWTAVQGKDCICVVTKDEDVDRGRLKSFLTDLPDDKVRVRFLTTIVHEMEDPSSELRQRFEEGVKMRSFAAVSLTRGTGDEASKAIGFLKKKLENYPAFTYQKTVQTAISALQHLHGETFQATDILVAILMKGKETKLLNRYDIQKHLEVIREKKWV